LNADNHAPRSLWEAQAALGKSFGEHLLYLAFVAVLGHGEFAYQQVARALQHLLLTEGKLLCLAELQQALQYGRYFQQRACTHLV
jgi:hypothetical protein